MKKLFIIPLLFFSLTTMAACSEQDDPTPDTEEPANPEEPGNEDGEEPETPDRPSGNSKILVAYFSATGTTQRVAERIVELTGADVYRIEAAEPYAENPYDDSDRIQDESYNDRRPAVATLPDNVEDYDVIFIGSPIWWHNPAMVVCTFLESYNLNGKIIVPFFTYGATTYLQQSIDKIYEVTPQSLHLRTYPGNGGVENWLRNIHIIE
ncbi:flavodoxin [Parabacteroides bouchesdurhonensis]|uniref:flavodoxin n=1 Tax=Parabacteroides bouchesdurhonensis TaxID=1936995 RepID=UPI000C82F92E|nr:flavodoxin [Parabacteroides bouchesdurhonensis]